MATEARIYDGLNMIFADVFGSGIPPLTPRTSAADVPGWDSIRMMAIVIGIEEHFAIRLRAREVETFDNVGDMATLLLRRLG